MWYHTYPKGTINTRLVATNKKGGWSAAERATTCNQKPNLARKKKPVPKPRVGLFVCYQYKHSGGARR